VGGSEIFPAKDFFDTLTQTLCFGGAFLFLLTFWESVGKIGGETSLL
jgi:hypothetical protein